MCKRADRPRWHKETLAAQSWHTGALYKHIISDHKKRGGSRVFHTHTQTHTQPCIETDSEEATWACLYFIMMMSCEHAASVSAGDGWSQLTSLDGGEGRGEGGAVSPSCSAMGFGVWQGNVSQPVGFQWDAGRDIQKVICDICASRPPHTPLPLHYYGRLHVKRPMLQVQNFFSLLIF